MTLTGILIALPCTKTLKDFFDRGGILAWGIVPTSNTEEIDKVTSASLIEKLKGQIVVLESMGIDPTIIKAQSLITPSCGTGSLSPENAAKVLKMTSEVSQVMQS